MGLLLPAGYMRYEKFIPWLAAFIKIYPEYRAICSSKTFVHT